MVGANIRKKNKKIAIIYRSSPFIQACLGGGGLGGLIPLVLKNILRGTPGGPNCSSHSKLLVLINVQYFHIRVCRIKIRNRDYLEHWSGDTLRYAKILHRLWDVRGSEFTITLRVCRQDWLPMACRKQS